MPVTREQLSQLIPMRGLPGPVLDYLLHQGRCETCRDTRQLSEWMASPDRLYLLRGTLQIRFDNGASRELNAASSAAHSPLPLPGQAGVAELRCVGEIEVVLFPRELIDSIFDSWWNPRLRRGNGIELKEDDLEDRIYMVFYQRIQAGEFELPGMPDIALRIARAVESPDSSSDDLARIITVDPALAARLIRTANSPAFGGESHITHCRDAVTRLGHDNTRNLVTSFVLKHLFSTDQQLIRQRMQRLWLHSRRVAAICHVLARQSGDLVGDQAILTGLIHDIGAIPILMAATEYPELLENGAKLDQLVQGLKGEVGALILRHWNFPQSYVDCVLHCNDWFRDSSKSIDYTDLVILAQLLSHIGTPRMARLPSPDLLPAFHKLAAGNPDPLFSLNVLDQASAEIKAVEQLLEGN